MSNRSWKTVSIDEIAHVLRGSSPRPKGDPRYFGGTVPRLMGADVSRDGRYVTPCIDFLTEEGAKLSRPMPAGTLTLVCSGDVGTPSFLAVDACIHDGFLALTQISQDVDPNYLYEVLSSFKARLERSATHGGVFTNLTTDILRSFSFALPPVKTQEAIASVLRTWDEGIDKAIQIQRVKEQFYTWLTEKLLVAPTLKGITEAKKAAKPLSEFTDEIVRRNTANTLGRELVMGVSNTKGIIPMRGQTIAGDLSRYKILPQRAFAYNPMRINVGSIAMSRLDSEVLVSPDYVLFACKEGSLDPDYFDHLCNTHWWSHHITESGTGSVRQRIYYDDLAALRIVIPPFKQQQKIARCLNLAKHEIEIIEAQIATLEKQKRGLMQKLLTGEWRVEC